jgi:hypothetical protein
VFCYCIAYDQNLGAYCTQTDINPPCFHIANICFLLGYILCVHLHCKGFYLKWNHDKDREAQDEMAKQDPDKVTPISVRSMFQ